MNIKHIHILSFHTIHWDVFYNLEITEGIEELTTFNATWGENQLKDFCNDDNITVTYDDYELNEETLEGYLNQLGVGYIEVQINADNSGEHDVNAHNHKFANGELVRDYEGKHIKTYKKESYAMKFAESFRKPIVLT